MEYRNPTPTVDVVVYRRNDHDSIDILLIERVNPPHGWALPGGFVDEGEMVETAAIREVEEETGLTICLDALLYVYSNPNRDSRQHNLSVVFTSEITMKQSLQAIAGDDAQKAEFFNIDSLPKLAFDHAEIIADFTEWLNTGIRPNPMKKCTSEKS